MPQFNPEQSTFLSWEEMQSIELPANATMLVPPPPQDCDLTVPAQPPPAGAPTWLQEGFFVDSTVTVAARVENTPDDPDAARAAAEREQYGPPQARFLAGVLTTAAALETLQAPPRQAQRDDKEKKKDRTEKR